MAVAQACREGAVGDTREGFLIDEVSAPEKGQRGQPGARGMGVLGVLAVSPEPGPSIAIEEAQIGVGAAPTASATAGSMLSISIRQRRTKPVWKESRHSRPVPSP